MVSEVGYVVANISGEQKVVLYPIKYFVWGTDRVLVQIDAKTNQTYYYLYNGHGDIVQIVDTAGNVVNTYDYDIWGNFLEKTETIDNPFTYFGQTYDETTELYYLRARYYDPYVKRFTSYDIIEGDISNPLDMKRYAYCRNNPIKYVDPSGEFAIAATIASAPAWLPYAIAGATVIAKTIYWAKGKAKSPAPPSKLKNGDKVKTPDTHPGEFTKKKDGSYEHKKTGWRFKKDPSKHGGDHWDASPSGKSGDYINVNPNGSIR